jgi:hypothetical protein
LGLLLVVGMLSCACNRFYAATPTPLVPTSTVPVIASGTAATPATPAITSTITSAITEAITTTATIAPTSEASEATPSSIEPSSNGIARQGAIFTSPRYSYTVVLPCCWLALPTPGTAVESALAELDNVSDLPVWGDLSARMRERESGAVLELIALLPAEENAAVPLAQVTVSVLPANGLTLDDYLEATQAELNSIANTSVLTAQIEATLGVGVLPASVIEYTAAPAPVTDTSEQTIAGLQVAFLGESADTLIVLTFTTTTERYAELQPEFLHIVRTVTLGDPAV